MLRHLSISNYALIAALDMDFQGGFSVLTGETGAGKSIILGALGLIMGQRADVKSITEGEQKCVIEAEFDVADYHLADFFAQNDLDYDAHCTIRRELLASGKSRSFVNDTPVALSVLKELTAQLIDIHSQHENLLLGSDHFQLMVVDTLAGNAAERVAYGQAYADYKTVEKQLAELREKAAAQRADADYITFQCQQLQEAHLQAGELAVLEAELNQLSHAEDIKRGLEHVSVLLETEESGVLPALKDTVNELHKLSAYTASTQELSDRVQSVYIEMKDIAQEADALAERTEYDPQRQQQVEERVDLLNTLLQKHKVETEDELLALRDDFEAKLHQLESFDEDIAALDAKVQQAAKNLQICAEKLTQSRMSVKPKIERQLIAQLGVLGIPHPQFEVAFSALPKPVATGADDVQFLFAANKNQTLRNVSQVASGGEVARLMLCIKALLADTQALPTLIFDEIDTGVSGEVADSMGNIMRQMGSHIQVLAITHLPQIAAKGAVHYQVYKTDNAERTESHIRRLTDDERLREIAQMLSGANVTQAAMDNARALLQ